MSNVPETRGKVGIMKVVYRAETPEVTMEELKSIVGLTAGSAVTHENNLQLLGQAGPEVPVYHKRVF